MEKWEKMYQHLTGSEKAAFFCSFAGGMTAHLYCFANTIPNFDGISRVYDEQQMTLAGRWFLHYASGLNGYMQMPMVIGVEAMFFLALGTWLTVRLFRIHSPVFAGLWGILTAVFPAVADINTYTYTASAYSLAFFLAVLGVWMAARENRRRFFFAGGVVCMALSMGIYQAYCTVSITLCMLLLLCEALGKESDIGGLLKKILRYLLYLSLGAGLYYGILKLFLYYKDIRLWSYLGMNGMEKGYPIEDLGNILLRTYRQVRLFFSGGSHGLTGALIVVPHCLMGMIVLALLAAIGWETRPCGHSLTHVWAGKLSAAGGILLLLPLGVNFTQILSPWSEPRLLMKYSFVFYYLLPLLLWERWEERGGSGAFLRMRRLKPVLSAGLLALAVVFWQYDNLLYTMLNQAHRATFSFATNLVSRIESCEGYHRGMEVVIIGGFPAERYYTDIEAYTRVIHESALSSSVIPLNKHIYYYMEDWLNVPIEEPPEEEFFRVAALEEFKRMPLYPDDGSVRLIDGCIVVKMQENYTPRSQYEKEYENRK